MHCSNIATKEEVGKGNEKSGESTRPKPGRARLLRRSTSQCLLLNENHKDVNTKLFKQDSAISSSTSGLLFTRPLSSTSHQQSKPAPLPRRPKTSCSNSIGARSKTPNAADEKCAKQSSPKPSSPSRTSVPALRSRQSRYFSLQSIRRSLSVDRADRLLTKKGSWDEKERRFSRSGFMGMVTSIDEEDIEKRRLLVICLYMI